MKYLIYILFLLPWRMQAQTLFAKVTDTANPAVTFTNTAQPYKGVTWIDLDDDNRTDLFVSPRFLFRNEGNGVFKKLTDVSGVNGAGQIALGISWGDLNNDGFPDCISAGSVSGLHRNKGDNTFSLASSQLPGFATFPAWDCALADADNNGLLDLLYVHASGFHTTGPFPCKFFLQQTDGSFNVVTGFDFTDQTAPYTVPTWSDYDLDGDLDLFIASGPASSLGFDFCFKNMLKENNAFGMQRINTAPFNAKENGQVYNFPDYDNDGDLDVCLTNYAGAPCRFWENKGSSQYLALNTPFTKDGAFLANCWGDVDNDGDEDVLISEDGVGTVAMYQNNDGVFAAGQTAGTAEAAVAGIALADYDNDGDLDFYTNGAGVARALFQNEKLAQGRNWVQFSLQGTQSNRSAIGAVLRVKAAVKGTAVWQIRQVLAHNSFQGQNDLRQHFGLNMVDIIDSVEVRWPSGLVEKFAGVPANQFYKIVEGQGLNPVSSASVPEAAAAFEVMPNPVEHEFLVYSNRLQPAVSPLMRLLDASGRAIPIQVSRVPEGWRVRIAGRAPAGLYFLKAVFDNRQRVVLKVQKK